MAQWRLVPDQISIHVTASFMTTTLLQIHVVFHKFRVFNAKCPSALSLELSKWRNAKFHSKGGSMTPISSHPMIATPPDIWVSKDTPFNLLSNLQDLVAHDISHFSTKHLHRPFLLLLPLSRFWDLEQPRIWPTLQPHDSWIPSMIQWLTQSTINGSRWPWIIRWWVSLSTNHLATPGNPMVLVISWVIHRELWPSTSASHDFWRLAWCPPSMKQFLSIYPFDQFKEVLSLLSFATLNPSRISSISSTSCRTSAQNDAISSTQICGSNLKVSRPLSIFPVGILHAKTLFFLLRFCEPYSPKNCSSNAES